MAVRSSPSRSFAAADLATLLAAPGTSAPSIKQGLNSVLITSGVTQITKARKAIGGALAGVGRAKIALVGDSQTAGYHSESATVSLLAHAPSATIAKMLGTLMPVSTDNVFFGNEASITLANYPTYDPRVTVGSGWGEGVAGSLGAGSSTTALTFRPTGAWNKADIITIGLSAGPDTFTCDVGGTASSFTPSPYALTRSTYSTGAAATVQTLNIKRTAGSSLFVYLVDCYDSASPKVSLFNMGISGSAAYGNQSVAGGWATTNGGNLTTPTVYDTINVIGALAPDLTVFDLLGNDYLTAVSIANFSGAMQALVTKARVSGSAALVIPIPIGSAPYIAGGPVFGDYVTALYSLSSTLGLPILDLPARYIDYATGNAAGLYSDANHLNAYGYADKGLAEFGFLRTMLGA